MKGIQWNLNEENYQFYTTNAKAVSENEKDTEKQLKNGTIYAGNVKALEQNSVAGVKENAQKRALKKLVDQLVNDLGNDDILTGYEERIDQASEDIKTRSEQIKGLGDSKEKFMESYGVAEEDIDRSHKGLIRKSLTQPEKLTAEDKETLAAIPDSQKDILTCEVMQDIHTNEIDNDRERKKAAGQAIDDFKVELLKEHPMVDAQKEADAIMEEAKQTALGMLFEEGKDKIDNDIKENEEAQEKKEEEKKEEEQRTEKDSARTEQMNIQDSISELQNAAVKHEKVQREVKRIMDEELLIEDDLKGLNLDELL